MRSECRRRELFALAVGCSTFLGSGLAFGEAVPSGYRTVAAGYEIPPSVLYAVARTESRQRLGDGRMRPWPWTLNAGGQALRFRSRRSAYRALQMHLSQGLTSIDIGLMQINWRYHRARLGTPWQALDPYHNLKVGAAILRDHYRVRGGWAAAVGAYHSPGRRPAQRRRARDYRQRVAAQLVIVKHAAR